MARPLRIEFAGGLYHVTSRGDRREDIYLDEGDHLVWLQLLGEVCDRFNWRCHAFCQMTNHYHMVVETPEGNLSHGMRQLNGVYTQQVNRRHARSGHVFQGRYKAILVEKENYLLELSHYVVLNPVRARMVSNVGKWPWSSYQAMLGSTSRPDWLETDWLLGQFSGTRKAAIKAYVDFVRAGVGLDSLWSETRNQVFRGSEGFVASMQRNLPVGDLREVPRLQRRGPARPLEEHAKESERNSAIDKAYRSGDYTMKQLADHFGVHYATVSRIIRKRERDV